RSESAADLKNAQTPRAVEPRGLRDVPLGSVAVLLDGLEEAARADLRVGELRPARMLLPERAHALLQTLPHVKHEILRRHMDTETHAAERRDSTHRAHFSRRTKRRKLTCHSRHRQATVGPKPRPRFATVFISARRNFTLCSRASAVYPSGSVACIAVDGGRVQLSSPVARAARRPRQLAASRGTP